MKVGDNVYDGKQEGAWVSVSEFGKIMDISASYVYIMGQQKKIQIVSIEELYKIDPAGARKFGRGPSGTCTCAVWLPDDMDHATERRKG